MRVTIQLIDYQSAFSPRLIDREEFKVDARMANDATFPATTCDLNDRSIKVEQLIK